MQVGGHRSPSLVVTVWVDIVEDFTYENENKLLSYKFLGFHRIIR